MLASPPVNRFGYSEVAGQADEAVGDRLLGLQNLDLLIGGPCASIQRRNPGAAAPATVEDEAAAIDRPWDVEGRRHGPAPVDDADGGGKHGQAVQEVGGAVERVQHPQRVAGGFLGLFFLLGGFLAQDTVVREAADYLLGEICLRLLVGRGHRIALLVVLELYLDTLPEVPCQDFTGAAGQLDRVAFDFKDLRVI